MAFLDDLPGIRDVAGADGEILPRRAVIVFEGDVTIEDDPREGVTRVIVAQSSTTITPPEVAANQNDYEPTDWAGATIVRMSTDEDDRVFTGFRSATTRRLLINIGDFDILINNDSESSIAANRVLTPYGDPFTWEPGMLVELYPDSVAGRWRLVRA